MAAYRRVCDSRHLEYGLPLPFTTRTARSGGRRAYVLFLFLIFTALCQTNHLNIYWTDLRQTCRVGRTMTVDERSEVSFSILQGTLP